MFNIHKISMPNDNLISHTFPATEPSKIAGLLRERKKVNHWVGCTFLFPSKERRGGEVDEGRDGETVVESAVEQQG